VFILDSHTKLLSAHCKPKGHTKRFSCVEYSVPYKTINALDVSDVNGSQQKLLGLSYPIYILYVYISTKNTCTVQASNIAVVIYIYIYISISIYLVGDILNNLGNNRILLLQ
jgi:hypothetical protein